ncbi:MAG: hypothetical protein ACXWTS_00010 [Methylococcaceae bacterium]
MISISYRKFVYGVIFTCIFIIIIMPDVVFGLLFELIHFLLELLLELAHVLFEWIESALDTIVEHIFHTDLHQTQVIVFYIMMSVAGYGFYRLMLVVPRHYEQLKEKLIIAWIINKTRITLYWQGLPINDRVKLIAICTVGIGSFIYLNF